MKLPQKDCRTSLAIFGLFILMGFSQNGFAQTVTKEQKEVDQTNQSIKSSPLKSKEADLDTEESLKYMGSRLLFQVKKRLHLTTEEDEESEEKEKKKNVKLNIFGITVERS